MKSLSKGALTTRKSFSQDKINALTLRFKFSETDWLFNLPLSVRKSLGDGDANRFRPPHLFHYGEFYFVLMGLKPCMVIEHEESAEFVLGLVENVLEPLMPELGERYQLLKIDHTVYASQGAKKIDACFQGQYIFMDTEHYNYPDVRSVFVSKSNSVTVGVEDIRMALGYPAPPGEFHIRYLDRTESDSLGTCCVPMLEFDSASGVAEGYEAEILGHFTACEEAFERLEGRNLVLDTQNHPMMDSLYRTFLQYRNSIECNMWDFPMPPPANISPQQYREALAALPLPFSQSIGSGGGTVGQHLGSYSSTPSSNAPPSSSSSFYTTRGRHGFEKQRTSSFSSRAQPTPPAGDSDGCEEVGDDDQPISFQSNKSSPRTPSHRSTKNVGESCDLSINSVHGNSNENSHQSTSEFIPMCLPATTNKKSRNKKNNRAAKSSQNPENVSQNENPVSFRDGKPNTEEDTETSSSSITLKICAACGAENACNGCSRCKAAFYCNVECQKSHWKLHKKQCMKI